MWLSQFEIRRNIMKLSLKNKILLAFLSVGLIPLISIGVYSYIKSSNSLQSEALAKLEAINNLKAKSVENYFQLIKKQILNQAHDERVKFAFGQLNSGFNNYLTDNGLNLTYALEEKKELSNFYINQFGNEYSKKNENKKINAEELMSKLTPEQQALQIDFIVKNANSLGSKHLMDSTKRKGLYDQAHLENHANFREYLEKFELYDIFLLDAKTGNVIYSVYKELDFATSMKTGPYKDSGLGKAFRKALDLNDKESVVMEDYEVYTPSYDGPAGFIAAPIWIDGEKKV